MRSSPENWPGFARVRVLDAAGIGRAGHALEIFPGVQVSSAARRSACRSRPSPAAAKMRGYSVDSLMGRPVMRSPALCTP